MDSEKILKLAVRLSSTEKALKIMNSGNPVSIEFCDGRDKVSMTLPLNTDTEKTYGLSESFAKALDIYREQTERDILAEVRPR